MKVRAMTLTNIYSGLWDCFIELNMYATRQFMMQLEHHFTVSTFDIS